MNYIVSINGIQVPAEEAKISVFDASYLYGEGVFETLVAIGGKVVFFERHLSRLFYSARQLKIPVPWSRQRIKQEVYRTLEANSLNDAYIRIGISVEETDIGVRKRVPRDTTIAVFTKPVDPFPERLFTRGGRLIVVRSTPNDCLPIAGIKSTNYLAKVFARREIFKNRADEGVLLNRWGRVTECAGSNIFHVKRGRLFTPPLKEGLLPGITRQVLIELVKKSKIPFQEKPISLKELKRADEIFITSTLKGVMPIRDLDGVKKRAPGPVTIQLSSAYQSRL